MVGKFILKAGEDSTTKHMTIMYKGLEITKAVTGVEVIPDILIDMLEKEVMKNAK